MAEGGELYSMRDWGDKLPGQTLCLAGLVHVTLHLNPDNEAIDTQLMESAINLSGHLIEHAKAAYNNLLEADETIECAKTILKWLTQERLESFSARACLQKVKGRWPKMGEVNQGLSVLEDRGYILQEFIESPKPWSPIEAISGQSCASGKGALRGHF